MATKIPLPKPGNAASDANMRYLDYLDRWHATTSMMPTVFELAAAVDRSHSTTDIALNKLQKQGLIERTRLAHRAIRITEQGKLALAAYRKKNDVATRHDATRPGPRKRAGAM